MKSSPGRRGMTLIEILVVIVIVIVLISVSVGVFYTQRTRSQLKTIADGIVFTLERAKSDAVAGKDGSSFGVNFASTTYTYFEGSAFNPSDPSNISNDISGQFVINDTIKGKSYIVFSHLTGFPLATGTITVSNTRDASDLKTISVGNDGDVSVIQ